MYILILNQILPLTHTYIHVCIHYMYVYVVLDYWGHLDTYIGIYVSTCIYIHVVLHVSSQLVRCPVWWLTTGKATNFSILRRYVYN